MSAMPQSRAPGAFRRLSWPLAALLTAPLAAQQPGPATPRPELTVVDQVIATVNDAAILDSTLRQASTGAINRREAELGRPLRDAEAAAERGMELQALIDRHCLAQAAKTLGIIPPARVEELFQEELKQAEREQVRSLGSVQKFSQELKESGKTWETFEREQRLQKMQELTEQIAIYGRLQNQRNLFITPQMMRDFYRDNRDLFVYGERASVARVAFLVEGDEQAVMDTARALAEAWRKQPATSAVIAKGFPGARALADETGIHAGSTRTLRPYLVEFALQHPLDTVSEPIRDGSVVAVLRVIERRDARNGAFEDADVQAQIRQSLEQQVIKALRAKAIARSRLRTYIWPPTVR